ncbi:MAG: hypothetical protein WC139_04810 [Candidatus Kapaibacterium sp.]
MKTARDTNKEKILPQRYTEIITERTEKIYFIAKNNRFYRKGRPPNKTADLRLEGKGRKESKE